MKKRVIVLLVICLLFLCACDRETDIAVPKDGRYYLDRTGSEAYIEVSGQNYLLFSGVDMMGLEEDLYESWAISQLIQSISDGSVEDAEFDNKVEEIKEQVDLERQFQTHPVLFEFFVDEETGQVGFAAVVDGSGLSLIVEYSARMEALIFDEKVFVYEG